MRGHGVGTFHAQGNKSMPARAAFPLRFLPRSWLYTSPPMDARAAPPYAPARVVLREPSNSPRDAWTSWNPAARGGKQAGEGR